MIKVDGLEGVGQEDTLDVVFNKNAVDSGYINEDQVADAVANNLLPFLCKNFLTIMVLFKPLLDLITFTY